MARYLMSTEEKLRGVRKAIRTLQKKRDGPYWLIPKMKQYADRLANELKQGQGSGRADQALLFRK
jgi:hypothetical protein